VIPILYSMIRASRTRAFTMLFLAAVAAIAAISGPAYLTHVNTKVAAQQLRDASAVQQTIEFRGSISPVGDSDPVAEGQLLLQVATLPKFTTVAATELPITVPAAPGDRNAPVELLLDRQDACDHVTMISGRCVLGVAEVILPAKLAASFHLRPGDPILLSTSVASKDHSSVVPSAPFLATVTGVYAPTSPDEAYWGPSAYFTAGKTPPILTDDPTVAALPTSVEVLKTVAIATPAAFEAGLPQLRAEISGALTRATTSNVKTVSDIPGLIATIQANEQAAGRLVPVAAAPLVVLAWFVIFLAAAYTAAATRFEFGVVALRGTPRALRWWLAVGENILMIFLGTLASYAVARLFAPVSVLWAGIALAGSIVAVLLSVIKPVTSSAAPLLRRVPAAIRGAGSRIGIVGEILIVMAAIATSIQLRIAGSGLSGVTLLVPGLIILGTATATSFAVIPVARAIGHRAVHRGRIATALAAFGIGRKPGAQRVLVLMAVAVGLLAFAAAGISVGSAGRANLSVVQTGATRIVSLAPTSRTQLLAAVDAADPTGRWAMAAVGLPQTTIGVPPTIAVDAGRLSAVATWDPKYGPLSAAAVGALLHPSEYAPPTLVTGAAVTVDYTAAGLTTMTEMSLIINLTPLDGSDPASVYTSHLENGNATVTVPIPCTTGCRFDGFGVSQARLSPYAFTLQLHSVSADGKQIVGPSDGADWASSNGGSVAASPTGPIITLKSVSASPTRIRTASVPNPLPVVTTEQLPSTVSASLLDGSAQPLVVAAVVPGLPRLGRDGMLIDLRFANLITTDGGAATQPQVWLGPKAPADAIARLQAHGLIVSGSTTPSIEAADLNLQGPAQALQFHLVAALLAVLLAIGALLLVAVVDLRPRTDELSAMRVQGVSARTVGRAASAGYASLAAVASLIGLVSAALAWWIAGAYLPLFTTSEAIWPAPTWPSPAAVALPWLGGFAVLSAVALVAGVHLRRSVARR
jgi:putative ABC transport system permease protein